MLGVSTSLAEMMAIFGENVWFILSYHHIKSSYYVGENLTFIY